MATTHCPTCGKITGNDRRANELAFAKLFAAELNKVTHDERYRVEEQGAVCVRGNNGFATDTFIFFEDYAGLGTVHVKTKVRPGYHTGSKTWRDGAPTPELARKVHGAALRFRAMLTLLTARPVGVA